MKKPRILPLLLTLTFLYGCSDNNSRDIHEFTGMFNKSTGLNLEERNYSVNESDSLINYSALINEDTIICISTDENGIIARISITTQNKGNDRIISLCSSCAEIIIGDGGSEAVKLALNKGESTSGDWKIIAIESELGNTVLISNSDDKIHSNGKPTLKNKIEKEEITRPTAVVTQENTTDSNNTQ